jgi:hypothetical protein
MLRTPPLFCEQIRLLRGEILYHLRRCPLSPLRRRAPASCVPATRCGEIRCPGPQLPPPLPLTSEDEFARSGRLFGYVLPTQAPTVLMGPELDAYRDAYRVPGSMSLHELAARLAHTAHFGRGGCSNWFAGEDSPEAYAFARVLRECLPALLSAPGVCWLPAAAAGAPAATTAAATAAPAAAPDGTAAPDVMEDEDFEDDDCDLGDCYGMAFAPLT